jgi:hypothetical protein
MRTMMLAVMVFLLGPGHPLAQPGPSPLELLVGAAEYFGESYTERPIPGASFVFFQGEPIKVRLTILCRGNDEELLLPSLAPTEIFTLGAHRDGQPFAAQLQFGEVGVHGVDGRSGLMPIAGRLRLNPGEKVQWIAELPASAPGLYRLNFATTATDSHSRSVAPRATVFEFEVRLATTLADRAEILRREANRNVVNDDNERLEQAEAAANALEQINPNSVEVPLVRHRIAVARGNPSTARSHSLRAQEILELAQDTMLRQFKSSEELKEALNALAMLNRPK